MPPFFSALVTTEIIGARSGFSAAMETGLKTSGKKSSTTTSLDLLIIFVHPLLILPNTKKGAHYAGIKIFNHLPTNIKCVANEIQGFKSALKGFLLSNSFYSIEEYFNSNKEHIFQIVMV
jgi:hypothetical protein